MCSAREVKPTKSKELETIKTDPDAWEQFTKAVVKVDPEKLLKSKRGKNGSGSDRRDKL